VLVSYLVMMYISVYPVAISIRRTNVYEEKSLGLFAPEEDEHASFVGIIPSRHQINFPLLLDNWTVRLMAATHIREQLGFDMWYIFLGVFLICIIEASQIQNINNYVRPLEIFPTIL
jgi:Trk-type K+ transport system membrane component